jgi:hypothetical protein
LLYLGRHSRPSNDSAETRRDKDVDHVCVGGNWGWHAYDGDVALESRLHRNIAEALPYIVAGLPPPIASA